MSTDNTPAPQVEMVSELPEPGINTANHAHVRIVGYTADQMRAYAQAALNARAGGDGWIAVTDRLPEIGDYSVLAYFSNYESVDMIHVEEHFSPITDGLADDGTQLYTIWAKECGITHWQPLPTPPAALASQHNQENT